MARRQFGSMSAAWMEEGTGDKTDAEVAYSVGLSAGSRKPHFTYVVIE
jgi:hypothetical protein